MDRRIQETLDSIIDALASAVAAKLRADLRMSVKLVKGARAIGVDRGDGVFVAADMVAAPGCLSEIAWASAVDAGRLAVARAQMPAHGGSVVA